MDANNILFECREIGLDIDNVIIDGGWHYVPIEGKSKSKKRGSYILTEQVLRNNNVVVLGVACNHATGQRVTFDLSDIKTELSQQEMAEARQKIELARREAVKQRAALAEETAQRAQTIWEGLPEGGSSDYLTRKKVRNFGIRFTRGSIAVPVRDVDGKLWGLQFIDGLGGKKFLTGTSKKGRFHLIGEITGETNKILITEGYATGATMHMAMRWPVVVAFDAGNLKPVAEALAEKYSNARLIICADNDAHTNGNPGLTKGKEAATAVGGQVFYPDFSQARR